MAYTFGAAVTDGIDFTAMPTAPFNANRVGLCCEWVRPTTVANQRALWACGAASGLVLSPAGNGNIILVMDAATTDSNDTFTTGLVVDTWQHVSVLWNQGASTVRAARCWVGTETTPPVEIGGSSTSTPVGTWTGSGTTFAIGNASGGSLSFQGDIGGVVFFVDSQNSNLNSLCGIAAAGAITQAQADAIKNTYVDAAWRGDILKLGGMARMIRGSTQLGFALSSSLDNNIAANAWGLRGTQSPSRGTVTGATPSARRTPHSFDDNGANMQIRRQRGYLTRA